MSSINSGLSVPPIASSVAGMGSSIKNSTTEKGHQASAGTTQSKTETKAVSSKESGDRDADGRLLYQEQDAAEPETPSPGKPSPKAQPTTEQQPDFEGDFDFKV